MLKLNSVDDLLLCFLPIFHMADNAAARQGPFLQLAIDMGEVLAIDMGEVLA